MSLKENRFDCAVDLFEVARERAKRKALFNWFMIGYSRDTSGRDSMSLGRFLTLHGKEFSRRYPVTFEIFCEKLVCRLRNSLVDPHSQKLPIDLV
jgi:hypothetical protein